MTKDTKVTLYLIGAAILGGLAWVFNPFPIYLNPYIFAILIITSLTLITPLFLDKIISSDSSISLKCNFNAKKLKNNIFQLVVLISILIIFVIIAFAYKKHIESQIPTVHFHKLDLYLVETNLGEFAYGVNALLVNRWHEPLIIQNLEFKGKFKHSIPHESLLTPEAIDKGGGTFRFDIVCERKREKEKNILNFNLIEIDHNFHLNVGDVKSATFISPTCYRTIYSPDIISFNAPNIRSYIEGTWYFNYAYNEPNERKQSEITAKRISLDKWNKLNK